MSPFDPNRSAEERIREAMAEGPDIGVAGRYGGTSRFARRLIGRAVKFERDFNHQIDLALVDRIHEGEAAAERGISDAESRLNYTDEKKRTELTSSQWPTSLWLALNTSTHAA